MSNIQNIFETINWIESNLKSNISVEDVAVKSGYSMFYFIRLFKACTGTLPKDYILKRKLSEAANDLISTNLKITDIALKWGFSGSDSFSRAFHREFKVSPGIVRINNTFQYFQPINSSNWKNHNSHKTIIRLEKIIIAGRIIKLIQGTTSLEKEWKDFFKIENNSDNTPKTNNYIQLASWENDSTDWIDVVIGKEVDSIDNIKMTYVIKIIPSSYYLVYVHHGSVLKIRESYNEIYQKILPEMNQKPIFNFCFERNYSLGVDPFSNDYSFAIYIPIHEDANSNLTTAST